MPSTRLPRAAALLASSLLALTLVACSAQPAPTVAPTSSSAAEPIFTSDEEALAAAEEAYEAYLNVAQQIGNSGGEDPERVLAVVTSEYGERVIEDYEAMAEQDLRIEGTNTIDSLKLVERATNGETIVYACVGVGTTKILDAGGNDLTPPDRVERVPLVLSFEFDANEPTLRLAGSEPWSGKDFC